MNITQHKMIAFDLFGVLITEGHLISNGLMRLLPTDIDKSVVKENYEKFNIGEIKEDEFWKRIGQAGNDALRSEFLNLFQLDQDSAVVQELKCDYRLAILSNFPPDWAITLRDKFSFDDQFDPIVFSGLVKTKKPHVEIYKMLIESSGLTAREIAFVDDRLENLETAHQLGMTTIYYQREKEKHSYQADMTVQNLREIKSVLRTK